MAKLNKKAVRASGIVLLLIAAAYAIRVCSNRWVTSETPSLIAGLLRSVIYIGLFAAWGVSVRRRVIQP